MRAAAVLALLLAASPAQAGPLVGLFVQGCLPFVGNVGALRQWAAQLGLQPLPPAGQRAFLQGQPGIAFDATDAEGKFVLVSGDGGACAAIAERAPAAPLAPELEAALTAAGIQFAAAPDRDDVEEHALRHREYSARKAPRAWRIVLSTGTPDSGAHPMLSALPE